MVQTRTISDYRYLTDLPALSELTACLWYQIADDTGDSYDNLYLISMATSSGESCLVSDHS